MASSYTSPLTVVRDVETSILGGAVLESLRAGATAERMENKRGWMVVGWEDGGVWGKGENIQRDRTNYKVCQHKKTLWGGG